MNMKHNISVGTKFGRWTVVSEAARHRNGRQVFNVKCKCGTESKILRASLVSGHSTGCRCMTKSRMHGLREHPLYKTYRHMIDRCHNAKCKSYRNYGSRGITVCDEWRGDNGLKRFISDMQDKAFRALTLERVDNSKGYSPQNCIWASRSTQSRNTRRNVYVEHGGKILVAADWDREIGFPKGTVRRRIRNNWSVENALTVPHKLGGKYALNRHC